MFYRGTEVFVKGSEGRGIAVVLLHGWGASSSAMDGIYNYLRGLGHAVYALDFPGFGSSDCPPESWGVYDYADCTQYVLNELGLNKPVIVGHSFGGRIALILGARGVAGKLVLASAAGIKPKRSLKKIIAVRRYKRAVKRGKSVSELGSDDYRALAPSMKRVFVRVVNAHLNDLLPKINAPTLIFWGRNDKETPPYMAKKLHKGIEGSGLVMVDGAGHFAYAERSGMFNAAVRVFCEQTEK